MIALNKWYNIYNKLISANKNPPPKKKKDISH